MRLPIYQVDAFVTPGVPFSGNPAAIVPLERWLDDGTLQGIAAENNLSETAFFLPPDGGRSALRWFTPAVEVDLCGHATLATAHVIFHHLGLGSETVVFSSRSGDLEVTRRGELLELDFPARPPAACSPPEGLTEALGRAPAETLASADLLCLFPDEDDVRALRPDMAGLARLPRRAVIAAAPGRDVDFVSRFFGPKVGVPEDPVTGSAHTILIPFFAARLGKKRLRARQLSARGGELLCEDRGARVGIAGRATLYLEGTIVV